VLKIERNHGDNATFKHHYTVKAAITLQKRPITLDKHNLVILFFDPA
jgi:hypothetical protein